MKCNFKDTQVESFIQLPIIFDKNNFNIFFKLLSILTQF